MQTQDLAALSFAALAADNACQAALEETFGRNAGDARYTAHGRGEPGSKLRARYDALVAARDALAAARDKREA